MPEQAREFEMLQRLFDLVADVSADEREDVLRRECSDPQLRRRIHTMLEGADRPEPEPAAGQTLPYAGRMGQYTLLGLLGSGGLGTVYLAERMLGGAPYRVAVKMLAPHAAGPSFVDRFEREQHILASLDHPHVTKMLDAGIGEGGQPYLVMEYVKGQHLDVYCDARNLSVETRIRLMLQVCDAVGYAHRNLIVHLDLKPSNILVTDDGSVKLLDFGTSKLIQPDSLLTTTLMATPAFASPEQLRDEAVTTSCDVYSLGAILFQLLAGERPGGRSSTSALFDRAMNETEPEKLEASITPDAAQSRATTGPRLRQALKGDLTTITDKCLRPRPQDRYLTVEALAEDLQRYLDGKPVRATRQTRSYQLAKFVRRNRKAVAVSLLAAVVLLASLTYAAVRQQQALREAHRAVEMQAFMTQLFKLANTNYMGKPAATVPEFLKLGAEILPGMIKNPADERAGEISLAESMVFDGDYRDAEPVLLRAIQEAKAAGDIPAEAEAEGYGGMAAYNLGDVKQYLALTADALDLASHPGVTPTIRVSIESFYNHYRYVLGFTTPEDVALQRAAVREAHNPVVPVNVLAYTIQVLVNMVSDTSPVAEQQKLIEEALRIYKSEPYTICETASVEQSLGYIYRQQSDVRSVPTYRNSYESFEQCRGKDSHDALLAASALGNAEVAAGQEKDAIPLLEQTIPKLEELVGKDSLELGVALVSLARSYVEVGRFDEAEALSSRLYHLMDGKVNPMSGRMGLCHLVWARALDGEGRISDALAQAELADDAYRVEATKSPGAVANGKLAHDLVLELQAKLGNQKKPAAG